MSYHAARLLLDNLSPRGMLVFTGITLLFSACALYQIDKSYRADFEAVARKNATAAGYKINSMGKIENGRGDTSYTVNINATRSGENFNLRSYERRIKKYEHLSGHIATPAK